MAEDKLRVLYIGNSSYLSSGYSTYSHEVLSRLHKTGRFELAEMGQFGAYDDPRALDLPWKHYPVVPNPANPEEVAEYTADQINEYGAYKFERICLEFLPDVCINIDDWWGSEFIYRSPLRRHFSATMMPTCDAVPLMDQWVESYRSADAVFTYTDWAADVMRDYGVPVIGAAPPGADIEVFRPVADRAAHKQSLGIPGDSLVVGCFAPGTKVLMADYGLKDIERVRAGDEVVTHKGRPKRVVAAHRFPAGKPMTALSVMGEPEDIVCTTDHELLAVSRNLVGYDFVNGRAKQVKRPCSKGYYAPNNDHKWEPVWTPAGEIQQGDFLAFRIPDEVVDLDEIAHGAVALKLDDDLLFMAGLYLAEGSLCSSKDCKHHSISWAINSEDRATLGRLVASIQAAFGLDANIEGPFENHTYRVSVHSVKFTRLWYAHFGSGAATKVIPTWFAKLPPEKQLKLVRGWQAGDGCANGNRNIGVSINLPMVHTFRVALLRNGIVASVNKRNMDVAKGLFANAKQQWRLVEKCGGKRNAQFIYRGWLYSPVSGVKDVESPGTVYDLTVEDDESYSVFCKNVHNTVMRNQGRKLFPDLIESFATLRRTAPETIRDKLFLYLHTAHPDMGWDIVRLVLDAGVGDRTLFSYQCRSCRHAFPSLLAGATAACPRCKAIAATMPDSSRGLSREQLAGVYQTFDTFVQYSVCEGFGLPQVEAAACGVPVFAVDYSAMCDVVRKVGGFPVKVQRFVTEAATGRKLAYPDNTDLVEQVSRYLASPTVVKHRREAAARAGAVKHYTYDQTAAIWDKHLSGIVPKRAWREPLRLHAPRVDFPPNLADEEFVRWAFSNTLGRPDLAHSYAAVKAARDLMYGTTAGHVMGSIFSDAAAHGRQAFNKLQPFDREHLLNLLIVEAERANRWERERGKVLGVTA